jgi:thioredoxin 1
MSSHLAHFTDANWDAEVLRSSEPVMVDFTATWCGPCKMLAPVVDKLATELAGKVKVGKLDIDESPSTPSKYGVRGVPTVMVFVNGQRVGQHVGLANRETLLKLIPG